MKVIKPTPSQAAFVLTKFFKEQGVLIKLSTAQEAVARMQGYSSWNALTSEINPKVGEVLEQRDSNEPKMEVGSKVYFGRGPLEFIGYVVQISLDSVTLSGVEIGCQQLKRGTQTIRALNYLKVVSDEAEWERLTRNEPAFSDAMSRERFLELQHELELLELSIARGEDTDATDFRIKEIDQLMLAAPWHMCPDEGCVRKP